MRIITAALAGLAALTATSHAQETPGEALEALYEAISGPVGEARDWEHFRSLFLPGAQMSVVVTAPDGTERVVILTLDDYIERNGSRLAEIGFTETETRRETYLYGGMATILSAYEAIRADTGETIAVGVNSLTILNDEGTWKIASIAWRAADEAWPVERAFEAAE
ncbi:nuclear transport factor 2 family protein [Glycocaulis sp.]|uniref:nuclear transport factor 2 family protein n=1 Tax=Glycocaulis sp. TaxID=1969725 RepID=UPI003F6FFBB4